MRIEAIKAWLSLKPAKEKKLDHTAEMAKSARERLHESLQSIEDTLVEQRTILGYEKCKKQDSG